jgi:hypothetical protein
MAAARSTAAPGRTNITNQIPTMATTPIRTQREGRNIVIIPVSDTIITAKCPPETAVKCTKPEIRKASDNSSGSREVSPIAIPGTNPAACGDIGAHTLTNASRKWLLNRQIAVGCLMITVSVAVMRPNTLSPGFWFALALNFPCT